MTIDTNDLTKQQHKHSCYLELDSELDPDGVLLDQLQIERSSH